MMNGSRKVLLVGSRVVGPRFVQGLRRWGYDCVQVATLADARQRLENERFRFVLCQLALEDGSGSSLMAPVISRRGDLFLCMTVRDRNRWVPAVRNGRDCWGAPAMSAGEFKRFLVLTTTDEVWIRETKMASLLGAFNLRRALSSTQRTLDSLNRANHVSQVASSG